MPRQMPTTPGPRILRSSPRRKPPPRVPNRRPRFPTSTPPPGPSAHPSGFSIRSQQGSISFNPAAFKAPVRTSVATEFNSREQAYSTINPRSPSIGKFVPAANPPHGFENDKIGLTCFIISGDDHFRPRRSACVGQRGGARPRLHPRA